MAWTYERIEKLKKLWEEGLTASRIAAELGDVTRNAVIGKAHRLGLSGRMASKSPSSGISIIRKKKIHIPKNQKIIEITTQTDEPMNPTPFLEIKDGLCRWPIGEPENSDFRFCGRTTNEGFVYCQTHHKVAYQPLTAVREKRKIKRKFRIG
jgi:GcrA cell cycle regulator|tara:strand:- start:558 stop:1013 length:456 start_codon:yes stop_codon:yes gene_type:complete